MGPFGYFSRFLFRLLSEYHTLNEWLREKIYRIREAEKLPVGKFVVTKSKGGQIIQNNMVYDYEASVLGRDKKWKVLSLRPLPKTFFVIASDCGKKIVKV
jgi:hypothetical protein